MKVIFIFLCIFSQFYFFKDCIYLFREREREREREGEKYQCVVVLHMSPTEDLAQNPGMCPDWESKQWPFDSQARYQSTELHQAGLFSIFYSEDIFLYNEKTKNKCIFIFVFVPNACCCSLQKSKLWNAFLGISQNKCPKETSEN